MNSIFKWLQRESVPEQYRDLYAKIHELQQLVEVRTKEHEEHIAKVRGERDHIQNEYNDLSEWFDSVSNAFEQDIPSVLKQTPWRCGMFNFGKAQRSGVRYFNPGLVQRPDGLWLIVRRSKEWPRMTFGFNDLMAFKLEGDHQPVMGVKIQMPQMLNGEHFEDPRAIYHDGNTWISCCNFVVYPINANRQTWTGAHQILCQVNEHWNTLKRHDPIYGKNGGGTSMNHGDEKNWIWFFHDGLHHMIYITQPHTVVPFNAFMEAGTPYITQEINPIWMHGRPAGGTPPVLVDGEYWSFFHSSTPWVGQRRRYHMAAYAFEAKPPFRITKMSSLPLLSGSKEDIWFEKKPLVVFPNGAILKDGLWTVTFGVNDLASGWIDIPHSELRQIVRTVPPLIEPKSEPKHFTSTPPEINVTVNEPAILETDNCH